MDWVLSAIEVSRYCRWYRVSPEWVPHDQQGNIFYVRILQNLVCLLHGSCHLHSDPSQSLVSLLNSSKVLDTHRLDHLPVGDQYLLAVVLLLRAVCCFRWIRKR